MGRCVADGAADEVAFGFRENPACQRALLITDRNFNLIAASPELAFDFEGVPAADYYVFGLAYTGSIVVRPGQNVYSVPLASGSFRRTANRIRVRAEAPRAGVLRTVDGDARVAVCAGDGRPDFVGFRPVGRSGARSYTYLVTDDADRVTRVVRRDYFDFETLGEGEYRVFGLAYAGDLLVRVGDRLGAGPLASSCAALTAESIAVSARRIGASRLSTPDGEQVRIDSGDDQRVPVTLTGGGSASLVYVILDAQQRIADFQDVAPVDLRCLDGGTYYVYAFSYQGELLAERGQVLWSLPTDFATGCARRSDNAVVVDKRAQQDCPPACDAVARPLVAATDTVALSAGQARVQARIAGVAVVPAGFDTTYLLVRGDRELVEAIRLDRPSFTVTTPGTYRVYQLVAEFDDSTSPQFFDLSAVRFGETSVAALRQTADSLGVCIALSDPAAAVLVRDDPSAPCLADAGVTGAEVPWLTLRPGGGEPLIVRPAQAPTVPNGQSLVYIVTEFAESRVVGLATDGTIDVAAPGDYRVHAVVGQLDDPAAPDYLDLDAWVGEPLFERYAAALDAGLCFALEVAGLDFRAYDLRDCAARATTITLPADTLTLIPGGSVELAGMPGSAPQVPAGFANLVLLTRGEARSVVAASASARFTVREADVFALRSFVANAFDPTAPDYVDLGMIVQMQLPTLALERQLLEAGTCFDLQRLDDATAVVPAGSARAEARSRARGQIHDATTWLPTPTLDEGVELTLSVTDALGRVVLRRAVCVSGGGVAVAPGELKRGDIVSLQSLESEGGPTAWVWSVAPGVPRA